MTAPALDTLLICDHGLLPAGTCRECNPLPLPVGTYCGHCRRRPTDDEHTWLEVLCGTALASRHPDIIG